jgi:hypothetical protein
VDILLLESAANLEQWRVTLLSSRVVSASPCFHPAVFLSFITHQNFSPEFLHQTSSLQSPEFRGAFCFVDTALLLSFSPLLLPFSVDLLAFR